MSKPHRNHPPVRRTRSRPAPTATPPEPLEPPTDDVASTSTAASTPAAPSTPAPTSTVPPAVPTVPDTTGIPAPEPTPPDRSAAPHPDAAALARLPWHWPTRWDAHWVALWRRHGLARWRALQHSAGIDPRWPWPLWLVALLLVPAPRTGTEALPAAAGLRRAPTAESARFGLTDLMRLVLRGVWFSLVPPQRPAATPQAAGAMQRRRRAWPRRWRRLGRIVGRQLAALVSLPPRWFAHQFGSHNDLKKGLATHPLLLSRPVLWGGGLLAAALAIVAVTTPLDSSEQALLGLLLWGFALLIRRAGGLSISLLLITLSLFTSTRYIWWRIAYTLRWDQPLDLAWGLLLLAAECYAWLMLLLGYFQTAAPLRRESVPLPADSDRWPSVDIYIPTYNEPMNVVMPTVVAALALDWPRSRLHVHVLDDGKRPECRAMAESLGANYLVRPDNRHAKAGNLNHAMTKTAGEFIAIFDCDHVPTRLFLHRVMGAFLREQKLALVQTPHHFFSPDPFERNLAKFRQVPNEGELFHGLIQDGNDLWNATFFCGSCAVLRRSAVEQIGGFAVETVTEDAHTALRLQRHGHSTALINDALAAGLATESLSAHIGQRVRWARGMAQIFRLDNPFLGKGLTWAQRLCYGSAMLHFFNGGPRLIFLTAPIAFLMAGVYVIHAAPQDVLLYVLPHIILASITNSRLQGAHRSSFWSEVYETVLAWYIALPTLVALFAPRKGKFNVTIKGGGAQRSFFDWRIAGPFLLLAGLNAAAFGFGVHRLIAGPADEHATALLNMAWTIFNLLLIGAAIAVAAEPRQRRLTHRAEIRVPARLGRPDGLHLQSSTRDVSAQGAAVRLPADHGVAPGDTVTLHLPRPGGALSLTARVTASTPRSVRMRWIDMTPELQHALVQCTFARHDAWSGWSQGRRPDRLLASLFEVLAIGLAGYGRLARHALDDTLRRFRPLQRGAREVRRRLAHALLRPPAALPGPPALLARLYAPIGPAPSTGYRP